MPARRTRPEETGYPRSQLVRKIPSTAGFTREQRQNLDDLTQRYMRFVTRGVAPHLVVDESLDLAIKKGYAEKPSRNKPFYIAGPDDRSFALIRPGRSQAEMKDPLQNGIRFLVSHIDSPCFIAKTRPLDFEWDPDLKELLPGVLLATLPYGGVNLFQWNSIPVTLYGTGVKGGRRFERTIPGYIMGHSAHLDPEGTAAEELVTNRIKVVTGHTSRAAFLQDLGFSSEDDFFPTMWYVIPDTAKANKTLPNDYLVAYGHDNRAGTFAAVEALLISRRSTNVCAVIGFDYEETGSLGTGSAQGRFLAKVVDTAKHALGSRLSSDEILARSLCLSFDADYTAGPHEQPDAERIDIRNISRIGYGVGLWNHAGLSDATNLPTDFRYFVQQLIRKERIVAQYVGTAEIADTAQGAETVGHHLNNAGLLTADAGPTVGGSHGLSELMHAGDLYWTAKLGVAFLQQTTPYREIHKKRRG